MTTRREKSKPQKPQMNKQLKADEKKLVMENTWIENLGKYLLDISKYVTTGVVIASLFKDMDDSSTIYIVGTVVAVSTLIDSRININKQKKEKGGINYGNVSYFLCLRSTVYFVPIVLPDTKRQAVVTPA